MEKISDYEEFAKPKRLSDFYSFATGAPISRAPQSWCYTEEVWKKENSGIKPINLKVFIDKDNTDAIRVFSDTQLLITLEFVEITGDEKNVYSPESYLRRILHCDGYVEIKPEAAGEKSDTNKDI